jgi:hypothetical protein
LLTALAIQTGVWIWQAAAAWALLDQLENKVEAMAHTPPSCRPGGA